MAIRLIISLAVAGLLVGCESAPQSSSASEASDATAASTPHLPGTPPDSLYTLEGKSFTLENITAADYEDAAAAAVAKLPDYPNDTTANHSTTTALEAVRLRLTKGRVERRDSVLIFYPSAARPLHFVSSSCEVADSCTIYRFLGLVPHSEYWLAEVGYYEGGDYLLVHQRTGQHLLVDDYPTISPSGRRAVSAANTYQDIYQTDGVSLWQLDAAARPRLQWRHNDKWVPQHLRWADEHTLLVKATELDDNGNSSTRYFRLRLASPK